MSRCVWLDPREDDQQVCFRGKTAWNQSEGGGWHVRTKCGNVIGLTRGNQIQVAQIGRPASCCKLYESGAGFDEE